MMHFPKTLERDYARALRRRVKNVERATRYAFDRWLDLGARNALNERARQDSAPGDADQARRIIRRVRTAYDAAYSTTDDLKLVSDTFERADGYVGRAIGRDYTRAVGVEPMVNASTRQIAKTFIEENVQLIQDLPTKQLRQIESDVLKAIANGERAESIGRIIRERSGMARRRADLIARDQMGKAVAQLNQKRMQDLGFDRYIWRTSGDERVRPEHQERNGVAFSWSDPPDDGHPGEAINCRCIAEPIFADVLEDAGIEYDPDDFNQIDPDEWDLAKAVTTVSALAGAGGAKQVKIIGSKHQRQPGSQKRKVGRDGVLRYSPDMLPEVRREAAMDNWVNGPSRRTSVLMKVAAQQEFESKGLVMTSYNRVFSSADLAAMREDVRAMYDATQAALKEAGIKEVVLYRGEAIRPGSGSEPGALESWTSDKKTAIEFAKNSASRYPGTVANVREEIVPANQVFAYKDGPGWHDGRFGNQNEFIRVAKEEP